MPSFPSTGMVSSKDERVAVALEELQDLKGVWVDLGKIWQSIDELREKSWLSVAPRKVRQSLDTLLQQLKDFPSRLKQYASFEYVQRIVKSHTKVRYRNPFKLLFASMHGTLCSYCVVHCAVTVWFTVQLLAVTVWFTVQLLCGSLNTANRCIYTVPLFCIFIHVGQCSDY